MQSLQLTVVRSCGYEIQHLGSLILYVCNSIYHSAGELHSNSEFDSKAEYYDVA